MVLIGGFGNPLLDITVKISDSDLLQKYNLNEDDQSVMDEGQMRSLLNDISVFPVEHSPGGCAQNTLRVFQWLNAPNSTVMFGAIGDDELGIDLKSLVEKAGVRTRYVVNKTNPTGVSVAFVQGANRSLVAYIGASETINVESFDRLTDKGTLLNSIDLFYMEGFFLPGRREISTHILHYNRTKNKLFAFNISAPYLCKEGHNVTYFAEHCDILFGNAREYEALRQAFDIKGSVTEFAVHLSKIGGNGLEYGKMVVVTNGAKTVLCVHSRGKIEEMDVPRIEPHLLKDTTGAGDGFVAGFLTGFFHKRQPLICMKWGCWASSQIIQQVGCKIPDYLPNIVDVYN